jgi:hypothetical protein
MAGARNKFLEDQYDRLCGESSPYENMIGKDIGRSFPGVDMFRDPEGEGQRMLGRVLKCFSLYDQRIGYCQGLGFLVGPLLMHMGDKEAFCVIVRSGDSAVPRRRNAKHYLDLWSIMICDHVSCQTFPVFTFESTNSRDFLPNNFQPFPHIWTLIKSNLHTSRNGFSHFSL